MPEDVALIKAFKEDYMTMNTEYPQMYDNFFSKIPMSKIDVTKFTVVVLDKTTREPLENSLVILNEFEAYANKNGETFWFLQPDWKYI